MQDKINVKTGEFVVAQSPTILQSLGIGSCVVICLYDKKNKIGGLAHIMSPRSKMEEGIKPTRFADKSIKMTFASMENLGSKKETTTAKIIGGASMFPKVTNLLSIGKENIIAVRKELELLNIKIIKEDLGGNMGRSVWFDLSNGDVVVSKVRGETKTI